MEKISFKPDFPAPTEESNSIDQAPVVENTIDQSPDSGVLKNKRISCETIKRFYDLENDIWGLIHEDLKVPKKISDDKAILTHQVLDDENLIEEVRPVYVLAGLLLMDTMYKTKIIVEIQKTKREKAKDKDDRRDQT